MDVASLPEGVLLGIGNPLLDISANVDNDLLTKYGLKPNDAIMAEEKHMALYKELVDKYNAEFIAGGSVQNTMRTVQWILKRPNLTTYFGCVGNDDYAKILKEKAIDQGVKVIYQVNNETPTGTCAVLVTGTHRSLCANLAAAQKFTPDHLDRDDCQRSINAAKFIYCSGFFVAVSPESLMRLATHAFENDLTFIYNLSAQFVSEFYKEPQDQILPYVDVIFGNESEAETFAKASNFNTTNLEEVALKIAQLPKKNAKRNRVVVITQGCDPVILVENGKVSLIPVFKLQREQIVDTNGAGDSFTGGFISQMVLGKSYKTCVMCGIYTACHVIQNSGCTFSKDCDFTE